MDAQKLPVSEQDVTIAYEGGALYANRFFVSMGPVIRIAFAEQNGPNEKVFFRSAVAISPQDAISLARLLNDLVKPLEARLDEAMAAAKSQRTGPAN